MGGFCVYSRTLWVSPANSPVRVGVSLAAATPTGFFFQSEASRLYFLMLEPCVLQPVSLPSCSGLFEHKYRTLCSASCHLSQSMSHHPLPTLILQLWPFCESSPPWLSNSTPPTGLDECLYFNSLVSDILTVQFSGSAGCFLFFILLLPFFWLCEEVQHVYLCLHLGRMSITSNR